MKFKTYLVTFAVAAHSGASHADPQDRVHGDEHEHDVLEEVHVTATPLQRNALEMTQSASVLSDEALNQALGNSLGDTLKHMPGVASASFGANVGRPVIRGLDATRVGILENNVSSNDVSKVSQDHAVAIEPFMADQIEVLRGPATLLYGSDTIGGVVNVRTNRIPADTLDGPSGRALIQLDSVSNERYGVARFDTGSSDGRFGFHVDGFYRTSDNYEIPEFSETDPEPDEERPGELENSFLDNQGGAIGFSLFGDQWQAGVSFSTYDANYGIPGEGHHHEEEEEHEEEEHEGEEHEEEEEGPVTIDMKSRRVDAEIIGRAPFNGVEQVKFLLSQTDYEHTEFEGDEIGTEFENDTSDFRMEVNFDQRGAWNGVAGVQWRKREFSAEGAEAFVPPSDTDMAGIFLLQEVQFEQWRLDAGLRLEDVDTRAADGRTAGHSPLSISLGALWHIDDSSHFTLNLARAERAPGDEELFSDGPHIATQTFEIGDAGLSEETSNSLEFSYRRHAGRLTGSFTVYRNDFDDFIYLSGTGEIEDGFPVRQWRQQDAEFTGAEVELLYDIGEFSSGHWQWNAFADVVRADLRNGENVPRIPPRRIGMGIEWDRDCWAGSFDWIHASGQSDTSPFETTTQGYNQVDLNLSCELPSEGNGTWTLFAKAQNLLDEDIRNHTSFLKDQAPMRGRNITLGARVSF